MKNFNLVIYYVLMFYAYFILNSVITLISNQNSILQIIAIILFLIYSLNKNYRLERFITEITIDYINDSKIIRILSSIGQLIVDCIFIYLLSLKMYDVIMLIFIIEFNLLIFNSKSMIEFLTLSVIKNEELGEIWDLNINRGQINILLTTL